MQTEDQEAILIQEKQIKRWKNILAVLVLATAAYTFYLLIVEDYLHLLEIALPINVIVVSLFGLIIFKQRQFDQMKQNTLLNNEVKTPYSNQRQTPQTELNMQSRGNGNFQKNFNGQPQQYQQYSQYQQTPFIPQNQQPQIQQQNQMNWNINQQQY